MDNHSLFLILTLLLLVAVVAVIFLLIRSSVRHGKLQRQAVAREEELKALLTAAEKEALLWEDRHRSAVEALERQDRAVATNHEDNLRLTGALERVRAENSALQEKMELQRGEVEEIRKRFTLEFENIAGRLLKEHAATFALDSRKNMGEVLNPLKEKILLFEKKVEETYEKGLKDQTSLQAELRKLYDLNQRISQEAGNLTRALKGDVKMQGNWGEVVLERILERSGLGEGEQGYLKQYSDVTADGQIGRAHV